MTQAQQEYAERLRRELRLAGLRGTGGWWRRVAELRAHRATCRELAGGQYKQSERDYWLHQVEVVDLVLAEVGA